MADKTKIHIGTSGWHYEHWKGVLYSKDIADDRYLEEYIKHFKTAEINNSFYNLPDSKTVENWRNKVPDYFIFSVKASRYITHMKKLKDPEKSFGNFIDRIKLLREKLGPILFQLPPNWNVNLDRLKEFISKLPDGYRYTFEFRDPTWFGEETENILAEAGIAFCIYDFEGRQSPHAITSDFVYIRLHGPDGAYRGKYNEKSLSQWANLMSSWADEKREIFCYFDNDEAGYAAQNALKLRELLGEKGG